MKIDLITQKKNYMYVDVIDDDNIPYWYPHSDDTQYDIRIDNINYERATDTPIDINIMIGWESFSNIDNITLDIHENSVFDSIQLSYSDDDWNYGYSEVSKFGSTTWYPQHTEVVTVVQDPIYLNETLTTLKPFECKMIKLTFVNCDRIVLNNIQIEGDETININRNVLEPFIFEKFLNNIIPTYKDTDIEELAEQTIKMLDGDE